MLAGSNWFGSHLHDPVLASLVSSLDSDRSLSRDDMLAIFAAVENGVTATNFGDLETLINQASYLGMPDYVRDLSSKVVYGDPANTALFGIGNLHAGSSGGQLEKLVGLWFLGTDNPGTDAGLHYTSCSRFALWQ